MSCSLTIGKTPIPGGRALGETDLTLSNDFLAVSIAVESTPPWGLPRGGILDACPVVDGGFTDNRITSMDFIADNWAGRSNTYENVTVVMDSPHKIHINSQRDWGPAHLETDWILHAENDFLIISSRIVNLGKETLSDLMTGYSLCLYGGFYFVPEGWKDVNDAFFRDWAAGYDETMAIGIHAPFCSRLVEKNRLDMFHAHTLFPGMEKSFDCIMQIRPDADLSQISDLEIRRRNMPAGEVSGSAMKSDGSSVPEPYVAVYRHGNPYTWSLGKSGKYALTLPEGDYEIGIEGKGIVPSERRPCRISGKTPATLNFDDLEVSFPIHMSVKDGMTGEPVDAKIDVLEGSKPIVGFLGKSVIFTDLHEPGRVEIPVGKGQQAFEIRSGDGFFSKPQTVRIQTDESSRHEVSVDMEERPWERGWICGDFHHHSNLQDGANLPEDLVRAQLSAGLDIIFVSDHDGVDNLEVIETMAGDRGKPFIPGLEISANWGHFNIYPLIPGKPFSLVHENKTAGEIFAEARKTVSIVAVNHPFSAYGYFHALEKGTAPGGFDGNFDLLELNSTSEVEKTVEKAWEMWNQGREYYLTAGTDNHDVYRNSPGSIRMFIHPEGEVHRESIIDALKKGRSYASMGPVIYPEPVFGSHLRIQSGHSAVLKFECVSVRGLQTILLVRDGEIVESVDIQTGERRKTVSFPVKSDRDAWFTLVVEDAGGKKAFGNPIWIHVTD